MAGWRQAAELHPEHRPTPGLDASPEQPEAIRAEIMVMVRAFLDLGQ
jgi:hypothetical protein